jgi:uncharacterized membrane protein YhhN
MASGDFRPARFSSATDMGTPYAHSRTRRLWAAAAIVGAFLIVTALRVPPGAELTGQFTLQPAVKPLTAVLLAVAALTHPVARERRWPVPARLLTPWTALGAVCFAVSDGMIGVGRFVLAPTTTEAFALPIWWAYPASLALITAGFFFGRASVNSATPSV